MLKQVEKYLSMDPSHIPFIGQENAKNILLNMQNSLALYDKYLKNKNFDLYFSNGQEMSFCIMERCLAHLFGIDTKYILSEPGTNKFKHDILELGNETIDSLTLIESLLNNMDRVVEYESNFLNDSTSNMKRALNFYKMDVKLKFFDQISHIKDMEFGCINIKSNDKNHIKTGSYNDKNEKSTCKYFYFPSHDNNLPYYIMRILQTIDENKSTYIPISLLYPADYFKYFNSQEIIIPTKMAISEEDIYTIIKNSDEGKLKMIEDYNKLLLNSKIFDVTMNLYNDYQESLIERIRSNRSV